MKRILLTLAVVSAIGFSSCSSDDDGGSDEPENTCVTCDAYDFQGVNFPSVEICEGDNGNAILDGTDTTVDYSTYVNGLRQFTTCD